MQAIIIINPHDARQTAMREELVKALGGHAESVEILEYGPETAARYRIRALPALVMAAEHWQGEHLLDEAESGGRPGIVAEVLKLAEEEERALHDPAAARVGPYVQRQIAEAEDALMMDMLERGMLHV